MGAHMLALQHVFRRALAIIGLVAVLLGALEHEDLILQSVGTEAAIPSAHGPLTYGLNDASTDSGTEGTFRSELHRLWLVPDLEITYVPRSRLGFSRTAPVCFNGRVLSGRRALASVIPLRL